MSQKICIIWAWSGVWKALFEYYTQEWNDVVAITRQDIDLSQETDIKKLCLDVSTIQYDLIIYSAWVWTHRVFSGMTDSEVSEQVWVNTLAPLRLLRVLQRDTKFVYLSSIMRHIPVTNMSVYASMKSATTQTLRSIMREDRQRSILSIDLWAMKTPMHLKAWLPEMVGKDVSEILPKLIKIIDSKEGSIVLCWSWWFVVYFVFPVLRLYIFIKLLWKKSS